MQHEQEDTRTASGSIRSAAAGDGFGGATASAERRRYVERTQRLANQRRALLAEWGFMEHNKNGGLTPSSLLLILGALILVGGTGAAPFIYTLF